MINPVKKILPSFIEAGADIITIHHEICDNVFDCIKFIKKHKKRLESLLNQKQRLKKLNPISI